VFDLADAAFPAGADGVAGGLGDGEAEQLVGADVEGAGEFDQEAGGRVAGLAFVVGNHAARFADLVGQLLLGVVGGLTPQRHALTESGHFMLDCLVMGSGSLLKPE